MCLMTKKELEVGGNPTLHRSSASGVRVGPLKINPSHTHVQYYFVFRFCHISLSPYFAHPIFNKSGTGTMHTHNTLLTVLLVRSSYVEPSRHESVSPPLVVCRMAQNRHAGARREPPVWHVVSPDYF